MAAANTLLALNMVLQGLTQVLPAMLAIKQAHDSGVDLTEEQLTALFSADDIAKAKLEADIKAAGG